MCGPIDKAFLMRPRQAVREPLLIRWNWQGFCFYAIFFNCFQFLFITDSLLLPIESSPSCSPNFLFFPVSTQRGAWIYIS